MASNFIVERTKLQIAQTAFAGYNSPVIVPSTLRSEVALSTSNNFNFVIQRDQGSAFNTEIRLNLKDAFTITDIGFFVAKPSSATDINFKPYTYPSEKVFSAANTGESLTGLYSNGRLSITKDQVKYIENWDLYKHYYSPAIQQAVSYAGYTTTDATLPDAIDQQDGSEYGFVSLATPFTFTGSDNVQIQVTTPLSLTAVESNSRLILMFRGFIAYNVA